MIYTTAFSNASLRTMITKEYISFFEELAANNNKEWFQENRDRYENHVKQPFTDLVIELIAELKQIDPGIQDHSKNVIFRINRDVRFSKDKSPYKLNRTASFTSGGKKTEYPAFYLDINATQISIGGGLYMMRPEILKKVRTELTLEPDVLPSLLAAKNFKKFYPELLGEKGKRLPPELKDYDDTPYVFNKQFYFMKSYPVKEYLNKDIVPFIMEHFKAASPVIDFFNRVIQE